jgi:hypothetical protein
MIKLIIYNILISFFRLSPSLSSLLAQESLMDMGDDTTSSNGCLYEKVQLLVSSDSQLQVSGSDSSYYKRVSYKH